MMWLYIVSKCIEKLLPKVIKKRREKKMEEKIEAFLYNIWIFRYKAKNKIS